MWSTSTQNTLSRFRYLELSGPIWTSQDHWRSVLHKSIHVVLSREWATKVTGKQIAGATRNKLSEPHADENDLPSMRMFSSLPKYL